MRTARPPLTAERDPAMAGRVDGKAIVISGAGSGMGRAFALGFAREGATVGVLDVNQAAAESVSSEIVAIEGAPPAVSLTLDVRRRGEFAAALHRLTRATGRLEVVFNKAE